ncbi:hypothetical protein BDL97_02G069600 [Sphagnum fallax]|nr:hypothetical protein BDL97_02G069600 [Sphagnum fallax]
MQPQGSSAVVCGRAVSAQTPACNSQGCRNSSSNYDFSPILQQQKGAAKGRLRPQKLLSMQLHLLGTQCCASSESSSRSLSYRRIIFNGRYGQFPVTHSATILPREVGEMIQQRSKQFAQVRRVKCSTTVDGRSPLEQNWQQSETSIREEKWSQSQGSELPPPSPPPPQFAAGAAILKELHQRLPSYATDFADGLHPKAAAAIVYMTFACLAPCFAFGGMIARLTECQMGLVETIISCSVSGSLYSLLAAQPLTLLGPTGFMVAITGLLYKVTMQAMVPFLPVYGWVGIWTCFFLSCLAAVEASNVGIGNLFKPASPFPIETALLSFLLAGGTFTLAKILTQLRATRMLLLQPVAGLLADFGAPLAILTMSMVGPILFPMIPLPAMPAPSTISTTVSRPWLVPLFSIPGWAIAASAIPAAFVSLLIFLDQNMTTRLVNNSKIPLRKGAGYNLDLAAVGVIVGLTSLFGLPWMVASAVPSLNHVRSLVTLSKSMHISNGDSENKPEMYVLENRLTGLLISVCVGISLCFWSAIRLVPLPVTSGLFVFMALGIINGNQFVERVKLWLYDQKLVSKHDFMKDVPQHVLHAFTALQLACLWGLWSLKQSAWGITFPILILALVPIRQLLAARIFPPQYLAVLDPH